MSLAQKLNAHGDIQMLNRFFDADCPWYLVNFETGNQRFGSYAGRSLIHPNIANLVHPAVKAVASVLYRLHAGSQEALVREAALAVGPTFAALRSAFLFLALFTIGFGAGDALLLTALSVASFSGVLFGALPESFGISSALFALVFFLLAMTIRTGNFKAPRWILAGTLILGTTITNIVPFALAMSVASFLELRRLSSTIKQSAKVLGAVAVMTAAVFVIMTAVHGSFKGTGLRKVGQLEEVRPSLASAVQFFPAALRNTFIPPEPSRLIGRMEEGEIESPSEANEVRVRRFTFRSDLPLIMEDARTLSGVIPADVHRWQEIGASLLLLAAFGVSVFSFGSLTPEIQLFSLAACAQVLFHWVLHSFFGYELFLYSEHWLIPMVIVLGAGVAARSRAAWAARALVAVLVLAATVQSSTLVHFVLTTH